MRARWIPTNSSWTREHMRETPRHESSHKLISIKDVCGLTTLSRAGVYKLVGSGKFPAPIKVGGNRSGWLATEIDAWLTAQVEASRKSAA